MPVTKLEIKTRGPFAGGQSFGEVGSYEQVDGVVHFAVDPDHAANETIADIKLAPRDADGRVTFSSDFRVLQPVDPGRGNRRMLFDILNRGKAAALRNLNSAPDVLPSDPLDPGNGFLMRQGYAVAWCGWQHDVPSVPGVLGMRAPGAAEGSGPVSGRIVVTFHNNAPTQVQLLSDRNHQAYPADNLDDPGAVLTVQEHEDAPETIVPRDRWSFARLEDGRVTPDARHVYCAAGFEPGKVYQVIYTTTGAPVVGLGLLATRDLAAFLRYGEGEDDSVCAGGLERAYTFGVSQSGRFLRLFLYLGLNRDEADRVVFDGFMPHVAGGKKGEFNQRFAQPSSQASRSGNSLFPFSDVEQTDPETGLTDGLLTRLSAKGELPKVMYTYTPSEYWGGHGSLVHTDLTAARDLDPPEEVRIYVFAGSQHALGAFPLTDSEPSDNVRSGHPFNCLDHRPMLRAALTNLDRWATSGRPPPASSHPRISDGTAVKPEAVGQTFGKIPGTRFPAPLRRFTRLDFGPDPRVPTKIPAVIGGVYPHLVSAVNADGNETGGVPLPFVSTPLATHTGWNVRHAEIGGDGQTLSTGGATGGTLRGSTIPFPATRSEREASGDPRLSIEERYESKAHYQELVRQSTQGLIQQGYLLEEDADAMVELGGRHYDLMSAGVKAPQAAD